MYKTAVMYLIDLDRFGRISIEDDTISVSIW